MQLFFGEGREAGRIVCVPMTDGNGVVMPLPADVLAVWQRLRECGYEAWLVGGCVRDTLLGQSPKDYDITTNARPAEVTAAFADVPDGHVIATGLKHGTVTAVLRGTAVEITTYRIDGAYSDGRRPDSVTFAARVEDDLARRDFTVNAMAYAPAWEGEKARFLDLFGGADDLRRGVIRCVGQPEKRFGEDALRILRALRFASALGFTVEPRTAEAIHRMRALLGQLAKERVTAELFGLLCGKAAADVLRAFPDVAAEVLPPLAEMFGCAQDNPHHIYDVWEHTLRVIAAVPSDRTLRLAALLHDAGKPRCKSIGSDGVGHFYGHAAESAAIAADIFEHWLRTDKKTAARVTELVRCHDEPLLPERRVMHRRLAKHGEECLRQLLALHRADVRWQAPEYLDRLEALDEAERLLDELVRENVCLRVSDLALHGDDLMAMGIPQGRLVGELLRQLLDEVCAGSLPNTPEALRARVTALAQEYTEV